MLEVCDVCLLKLQIIVVNTIYGGTVIYGFIMSIVSTCGCNLKFCSGKRVIRKIIYVLGDRTLQKRYHYRFCYVNLVNFYIHIYAYNSFCLFLFKWLVILISVNDYLSQKTLYTLFLARCKNSVIVFPSAVRLVLYVCTHVEAA